MIEHWWTQPPPAPDSAAYRRAAERQAQLTKPPGSLGRLETLAMELAALQASDRPSLERVRIGVFAADHGVAAEGVSAFPQAVTVEMVRNFARGGAAVSVLARACGARFSVVDVGTATGLEALPAVLDRRVRGGTGNIAREAAMSAEQCRAALAAGRDWVDADPACDLVIGGEMGIANTTAATAVAVALTGLPVADLVGLGTGVDAAGLRRKQAVIERALTLHGYGGRDTADRPSAGQPDAELQAAAPNGHGSTPGEASALEVLRRLGGLELAALAGAYIRAAQCGIAVLVDGFICTVAALAAVRLNPALRPWLLFSHCSAESGHRRLLAVLEAQPLLALDMRLGEASGAALAVPLLRAALALHNEMATFTEADVSHA